MVTPIIDAGACGSPREAKRSGGISVNPSRSRYEMVPREHFSDFAYLAWSFPAFEAEVIFIATDARGRATTLAGLKLSSVAIKSL